jgi:hypothetical protein
MVSILKWLIILLPVLLMVVASEEKINTLKKDEAWICVRWQWVSTAILHKSMLKMAMGQHCQRR